MFREAELKAAWQDSYEDMRASRVPAGIREARYLFTHTFFLLELHTAKYIEFRLMPL